MKRKIYAEDKNEEVKLLERSIEDLEITVCSLENEVSSSAAGILLVLTNHLFLFLNNDFPISP